MSKNGDHAIPMGKTRRGIILGAATAKAGIHRAMHITRRPFITESQREEAETDNNRELADIMFKALATLRGTALKVAQVLALEAEWFPESVRCELAKACYQVPPINRALTLKVIRTHVGPQYRNRLKNLNLTPFAAASLGQVHAATHPDGKLLAVKIQYPGIAEGIASDIQWLKTLLRPTPYFPLFKDTIPIVERTIREELDYTREAANTRIFLETLPPDRFTIPAVIPGLSCERILTTTRISGLHLREWLDSQPSQEQRNHFGQALADAFVFTLNRLSCLHADPNPGNYLFMNDGRLGILDFGCVCQLTSETREALLDLISPDRVPVKALASRAAETFGFHFREKMPANTKRSIMEDWITCVRRPFDPGGFDFSQSDDYFKTAGNIDRRLMQSLNRYQSRFVYAGRAIHGLIRMLAAIQAKGRFQLDT